jgi:hypothetical protein
MAMVFYATFNNISVIAWQSVTQDDEEEHDTIVVKSQSGNSFVVTH